MPSRKDLPEPIAELRRARTWPVGVPMPPAGPYKAHQPWSYEDDERLRECYVKFGPDYAARLLGRSRHAVKVHASRIGADGLLRKWSTADVRLLKRLHGKVPVAEIAAQLERSVKSVQERLAQLGLGSGPPAWTPSEIKQLRSLYKKMPAAAIAARLGRPLSALVSKARQLGLSRKVRPLTKAVLRKIMKDIGRVPIEAIATAVGMSHQRVAEIARENGYVQGRQWWRTQWHPKDDAFLRKHFQSMRIVDLARQIGRTVGMVEYRAKGLGLSKRESEPVGVKWSGRDDAMLRKLHATHSNEELAERLNRAVSAVQRRLRDLGLRRDRHGTSLRPWTQKEETTLRRLHTSQSCEEIGRRLNRTTEAVRRHLQQHGLAIFRPQKRRWTAAEDALLRRARTQSSAAEIGAQLGRSANAVIHRLHQLGISVTMRRSAQPRIWTSEDDALLRQHFGHKPRKELAKLLDRTVAAIAKRAGRLGLGG